MGGGDILSSELFNGILSAAPAFLLVAARALALVETAPLLSQENVPQIVKIALAGMLSYAVFPSAQSAGWEPLLGAGEDAAFNAMFVLLLVGEALIGIITGFFMTLVFTAASTAGQFFSLQMGFGAAETFDPVSQQENPLMGQYLNLVAMLVFLSVDGFRSLFVGGFGRSVQALSLQSFIAGRENIAGFLLGGLTRLFLNAIVLSMPVLGTLFLVSLTNGLISKAAPTINILSEGFPISLTAAFVLIWVVLPFITEAFAALTAEGFRYIEDLLVQIGRRI